MCRVLSEVPTSQTKAVSDATSNAASSINFETSINRPLHLEEEESWRSLMWSLCSGNPANTFSVAGLPLVTQSLRKRELQRGKERMRDTISS